MILNLLRMQKNRKTDYCIGIIAAYLAFSIGVFYNPEAGLAVTSFTREIGPSLMVNVDISKRIVHMIFYGFVLFPLLGIIFYFCLKKADEHKVFSPAEQIFISDLTAASFAVMVVALCNNSQYRSYAGNYISLGLVLGALAILLLRKKPDASRLIRSAFAALALLYPAINLLKLINIFHVAFILPLCFALVIAIYFLPLSSGIFPLILIPGCMSLFFELCNILNQYEIFVTNKALLASGISLIGIILSFFLGKREKDVPLKYSLPVLIAGITLLAFQPSLRTTAGTELFEASNHGLAVQGLFYYGEIPILENLDAHMLCYEYGSFLYGLLNQDYYGAIFYRYGYEFIQILAYYFLLNEIFHSRSKAALIALFFPLTADPTYLWGAPYGFYVILCAVLCVKKDYSVPSLILFFLVCILTCFYRLDIGASFAVASALVLLISCILVKESRKNHLLRYFGTGFAVLCLFIVVYCILCFTRDIHPVDRMMEFLDFAASNIKWNYTVSGDTLSLTYALVYVIIPAITTSLVLYTSYHLLKNKKNLSVLIILTSLFLAYLFNFPRGITRHNLQEGMRDNIVLCSLLIISLCLYFLKKRRYLVFTVSFTCCILVLLMAFETYNFSMNNVAYAAVDTLNLGEVYEEPTEKVTRIDTTAVEENNQEIVNYLRSHLDDGENYLDLSTNSLLYALVGKEQPVYINQSPTNLNREFSQRKFLEEIEANNCPYAITKDPISKMDGPIFVQSYLVFEYLYENYAPVEKVDGYLIWQRNAEPATDVGTYEYFLGTIPYLWETYDGEDEEGEYIRLHCDSDCDAMGVLELESPEGDVLSRIRFDVYEGSHDYLVRISLDPNWSLKYADHYHFYTQS